MKKRIRLLEVLKNAGTAGLADYDSQRGVSTGINLLCLFIVVLNLIAGPTFYFLSGNLKILLGAIGERLLMLGIIWLNHLRKYNAANYLFYFIINLATLYFTSILGKSAE